MTEAKKIAIADAAEMIVGGYAFLRKDDNITIVNLNRDDEHVMVITKDGKILESSMEPIEQVIALKKWKQNAQFMEDEIAGYYLYYTKHCVIECMHAHASDRKLTEGGSAKFFVLEDGSTIIQNRGVLNDREILKIQKFIKLHYLEMYEKWAKDSENGFFGEKK